MSLSLMCLVKKNTQSMCQANTFKKYVDLLLVGEEGKRY